MPIEGDKIMDHGKIEWKNDLDTGIEIIDRQHQEFIGLVNKLLDNSIKSEEITDTFFFLKDYINAHFSIEETAMMAYGYPNYATHKGVHDSFREEFNGMELSIRAKSPTREIAIKLNYLVVNWFMSHIKAEDDNLYRFLEARASDKNEVLSDNLNIIERNFFKEGAWRYKVHQD